MFYKIPFFVGNLLACVVPGSRRRMYTRAYVNRVLFYPIICRFIRREFGVRVRSIKFIRQITLGRIVFLVNGEYYVKVFRDVSNLRLRDYAFLVRYVQREFAAKASVRNISIPDVVVAAHAPMYASPRVAGRHLNTFAPDVILENQDKIKTQAFAIIDALTSIDANKIPNKERFATSMQSHSAEKPYVPGEFSPTPPNHPVLAHFDLNRTNCLFDDDLNIVSVIDWDGLSIAKNPDSDKHIFMKYWLPFIEKQKQAVSAEKHA